MSSTTNESALDSAPDYAFEFDPSLEEWNIPAKEWMRRHNKHWNGLASGCIVMNHEGKVLLIQRASSDSMPNLWEIPGGGVDPEDASVLHGAARELWEEAGLKARRFRSIIIAACLDDVPGQIFPNRNGTKIFCRFTFAVDVESTDEVKIDLNEHQAFVWATEDEVREQRTAARAIPFTRPEMRALVLESFNVFRSGKGAA